MLDDLQPHLRPDEELLWKGAPDPSVVFTGADVVLVPFTALWLGFAVFWEANALHSTRSAVLPLLGGVFVLVGLYVVVGRFLVKRIRKASTTYAVTSRRAMSITGRTVAETAVRGEPMQVVRHRDARHVSVRLGPPGPRFDYANTGMDIGPSGPQRFGFYDVADGDRLLEALERLRRG